MDMKKTVEFMKALRKEKGLTQEQLAGILLVSGRIPEGNRDEYARFMNFIQMP